MYIFHFRSPDQAQRFDIRARDEEAAIEFVEVRIPGIWDLWYRRTLDGQLIDDYPREGKPEWTKGTDGTNSEST